MFHSLDGQACGRLVVALFHWHHQWVRVIRTADEVTSIARDERQRGQDLGRYLRAGALLRCGQIVRGQLLHNQGETLIHPGGLQRVSDQIQACLIALHPDQDRR